MRCIFRFPSVTYAQRASKALSEKSILHSIIELDPTVSRKGCSYGVEIPCYEYRNVNKILLRLHVRYEYFTL